MFSMSFFRRDADRGRDIVAPFSVPTLLLCVGFALGSTAGPAEAESPEMHPDAFTHEEIVRAAYANLEEYTRADGVEFRLEVDDFRHLRVEDFDSRFFTDLVSSPQGLLVEMHRNVVREGKRGRGAVRYEPKLRFVDRAPSTEFRDLPGKTVRDVIDLVLEADPEHNLGLVESLTAFRVRATLGANTREYNAAFAWAPALARAGENTALLVLDQVTQGVEEAAREPLDPPARASSSEETSRARGFEKEARGPADQCVPTNNTALHSKENESSTEGHSYDPWTGWNGFHESQATIGVTCSCEEDCTNTCKPEIIRQKCREIGTSSGLCHKMQYVSSTPIKVGYMTVSECTGAFLCGMKTCAFCMCGLSIGVSISPPQGGGLGATVTFTPGDAEWTYPHEVSRQCPPCELTDRSIADPGTGDGGSSSGGGAGGGGGEGDGSGWNGDAGAGDPSGGSGPGTGGSPSAGESGYFDVYCGDVYAGSVMAIEDALALCAAQGGGGDGLPTPDGPSPDIIG